MSLFFIHGGPGFNSEPDRLILSNALKDQGLSARFWHEPSLLRPEGSPFYQADAYTHWLKDLHKAIEESSPRLVVASSFGAKGFADLMRFYPRTPVAQILMIGPTLDLSAVFKRMMQISQNDLQSTAPEISLRLQQCREGSRKFWDSLMQEGLGLVWQNQKLLSHYFEHDAVLALWAGVGADSRFGVDMQSQVAVLNDLASMSMPQLLHPLSQPVLVLSGASDPVFSQHEVENELRPVFHNVQFEKWQGCGHFPQMEKPVEFIQLAKLLLAD